jgi:hypothetical protein
VRFPPVVAFRDDAANVLWLADGFHRWHARKVLDLEDIEVEIIDGSRREALLYSLSANSKHGLQRNALDYRRAYDIAVNNKLVSSIDIEAVAALLRCSGSWATKLTERARASLKAERDVEIIRHRDAGKTVREIVEETGVPRSTVGRITAVPKQHSAEMGQTDAHGLLSDHAKAKLRELQTPAADNWAAALRALRLVNEQVSVETLLLARLRAAPQAPTLRCSPAAPARCSAASRRADRPATRVADRPAQGRSSAAWVTLDLPEP